ncbi:MAG TPA: glutathione S-transferase family protein [Polyangiaceae bacterium]|nr:glutathione S-transferase family protein [Polyangiaceae bacterium]
MILIGQYDSPFVRRVAIALRRYGIDYEHRPWSVFADAEKIAEFNPLRRVPTLVLDDGVVLVESSAILDALDELVPPDRVLLPRSGPLRRDGLRIMALATGFADKAVSLYLETLFRKAPSERWLARCREQIADTLDVLDADRSKRASSWWLGESLGHVDIAVGCALTHLREAHPDFFDPKRWPNLSVHLARTDALDEFRAIYQPFVVKLGH